MSDELTLDDMLFLHQVANDHRRGSYVFTQARADHLERIAYKIAGLLPPQESSQADTMPR